jgi:hypothetical protein
MRKVRAGGDLLAEGHSELDELRRQPQPGVVEAIEVLFGPLQGDFSWGGGGREGNEGGMGITWSLCILSKR